MEYKIFRFLRHGFQIPFFIRFIFSSFLIFLSSIPIILPLFPWSVFLWVFILVIWILLIVPWQKIRHVVKLRKWIVYLAQNLHRKHIIKHKMKDIRDHVRDILRDENNI
jgi:hypothetical protein